MKRISSRLVCMSFLSLLTVSCGKSSEKTLQSQPASSNPALNPVSETTIQTLIAVLSAAPESCPNGGSLILIYLDSNSSGAYEGSDTITSETSVCHGQNGSNGANAGIRIDAAPANACSAGGSQIVTWVDGNSNGLQDLDESSTSFATICNGTNGQDGSDGQPGAQAYISVTAANTQQCPLGGYVFSTSSGGQAQPEESVVCNGLNGQDGQDGSHATYKMGAVGEAVVGKNYTACHHDYLYFPSLSEPGRGWLSFRHQGNGSYDQGIGNTGFQVWNVDIRNFILASEVKNVDYCRLEWDADAEVLSYEVVDDTDGLEGMTGEIRLNDP